MKATRHAYVVLGGRRDGTGLVVIGVHADTMLAEEPELLGRDSRFMFGVAHRGCLDQARSRLRQGLVDLPDELPVLIGEEIDQLAEEYHHPPTGKFCPFCGSDKLTDEHVWPEWISRALREHVGVAQHERLFIISMNGRVQRRVRAIDIKAPTCGLCNNRWLAVLEQSVQPILEAMMLGEERILLPEDQLLLATWAAKTVLMFDVASGTEAVIPMGYYREFANLRTPLPSTRIWIGAYLGDSPALAWRDALWVGIPPDDRPNAFVTTITVFRVVFQVAGHFVKSGTFEDRRFQFASVIHRIWPTASAAIHWPPRKTAFGDDSLSEFATGFSGRHPDAA